MPHHARYAGLFVGSLLAALCLSSLASYAAPPSAECSRLPNAVLAYLKTLDPDVVVREDCLAVLSDNRSYLPILPQGHDAETPPTAFVKQYPEKTEAPDWIAFDHRYYLLRLIETANGKITLPRSTNIPSDLKTGLLPQNFMVPNGFSIPSDLRVLVGDLPYTTPKAKAVNAGNSVEAKSPLSKVSETLSQENTIVDPIIFTAAIKHGTFTAWDAISWKPKWSIKLPCLSTSAAVTPTGEHIYANCLNASTLQVLDVKSHQRLNQLEVGHVAQQVVHHPSYPIALALHRHDQALTFLDSQYHLVKGELPLEKNLQHVYMHPSLPLAYGVDTQGQTVLEIDIQNMKVLRELSLYKEESFPGYQALNQGWFDASHGRFGTLWLASDASTTLVGVDIFEGRVRAELEVEAPIQRVLHTETETFLFTGESGKRYQTLQWEGSTPSIGDTQPLETSEGLEEFSWMAFSPTTQRNQVLGLDANSGNTYTLTLNAEDDSLSVSETPVISNLRSHVLRFVLEPTSERLATLEAKRAATSANPEAAAILKELRTQPRRQNVLQRLGAALKFAPRDQ